MKIKPKSKKVEIPLPKHYYPFKSRLRKFGGREIYISLDAVGIKEFMVVATN